jgi:hypothetical protein
VFFKNCIVSLLIQKQEIKNNKKYNIYNYDRIWFAENGKPVGTNEKEIQTYNGQIVKLHNKTKKQHRHHWRNVTIPYFGLKMVIFEKQII